MLAPQEATRPPELQRVGTQDLAAFNRGVTLALEPRYEEAAGVFVELIPRFQAAGDRRRAAEAIFWAGYCYEKLSQYAMALEYYQRLVRKYSDSPATKRALQRLERFPSRGRGAPALLSGRGDR